MISRTTVTVWLPPAITSSYLLRSLPGTWDIECLEGIDRVSRMFGKGEGLVEVCVLWEEWGGGKAGVCEYD